MTTSTNFDVIIIGGSYAGLSAAMALGRSLRTVLIIDSGQPCNRQTPHSHNFLTHDGETPAKIAAIARKQVLAYPTVQFLDDMAIAGKSISKGFAISTQNNGQLTARKLIFATGISDQLPNIRGLAECWGISVIHCPYCHGYEFRHKKTGILANGDKAVHIASLVTNLSDDVTILTSGKAAFNEEQLEKLSRHGVPVVESEVLEIEHDDGVLKNVVFNNGSRVSFDAVYAAVPFKQHSDIPVALGCQLTDAGHIQVDAFQKTSIDGVFACGDNTNMMRSVANAVAAGNLAGAMVNHALASEKFHMR